jgi:hypothetical protein
MITKRDAYSFPESAMTGSTGPDELPDIALEQTFPAKDPPCFMVAAAVVGRPPRRKLSKSRAATRVVIDAAKPQVRSCRFILSRSSLRSQHVHPPPCGLVLPRTDATHAPAYGSKYIL